MLFVDHYHYETDGYWYNEFRIHCDVIGWAEHVRRMLRWTAWTIICRVKTSSI